MARAFWASLILGLCWVPAAPAQSHCPNHGCCRHVHGEGTPPPGRPRAIPHTDERAGFPRDCGGHLAPSFTPAVRGYYVGGGAALGGGSPCPDDGTWGWDDTGHPARRRRVALFWSRGRRNQGGTGAYATDGPHVPDVVGGTSTLLRRNSKNAETH